ncbi:MAG TPA: hypothetical protein VFC07_15520 [Verrucomicrobiae bacterium]|nr:hypothetical protein [Verrucomicrobiae bacterium]
MIILIALFFQVPRAAAQTYTMTDDNSSVTVAPASQSGVNNWSVEGQNQLSAEWFWYRVGNSGTAASIDAIGTPTVSQPSAGTLITTYQNAQFSLQVVYSLVGGATGSGTSDLSEQVKIQNLTSAPLAFNFFQYSDFSLGGANNQNVELGMNRQGKFNQALVSSGNISITESVESAISPGANLGEAGLSGSTVDHLRNIAGYNLNDNLDAGPGDATWALQWSNNIAANGTLTISKDLNITGIAITPVPEPPMWSVMSIGLIAFSTIKRYLGRRW